MVKFKSGLGIRDPQSKILSLRKKKVLTSKRFVANEASELMQSGKIRKKWLEFLLKTKLPRDSQEDTEPRNQERKG